MNSVERVECNAYVTTLYTENCRCEVVVLNLY